MSWLLNLYGTYEANREFVGHVEKKHNGQEFTLLPICHTTQNAHIEVEITEDGEFLTAFVVDKNEVSTLIPCTESSASRSGLAVAPYPLHDKLSYVAGDYVAYGGEVKTGELPYAVYIRELEKWAESAHAHPKVKSIYTYLSQGRLIQDLVRHKVLCVDADQRLVDRWDKKVEDLYPVKPEIFSVVPGDQTSAFVRFNVHAPGKHLVKVWKDPEVYESFIRYYSEQLGDIDYCYVTGRRLPATERHANKIRHSGDKAKLISDNDSSGFTFRGRFNVGKEAATISYEVSQKAHNALKWLINRQAKMIDQRVFLVWGNDEVDIPAPDDDSYDLDIGMPGEENERYAYTRKAVAEEVSKAIDGYRNRLKEIVSDKDAQVNILVLDSATTGRMGVLYYRNMNKELYLDRLVRWHSTCVWLHRYRKNEQGEFVQFYGAPSTKDIAFAAYGPRAGEKMVKGLMERMLPCIVDGRAVPRDIVDIARQRASNPSGLERWEWEKTLSIACALINEKEELDVALDEQNNQRDYLFGRLLAIADVLERNALGPDERRATNAIRYMNAFSRHPERTWRTIQACLQPYQAKLGAKATYWSKMIDEVGSRIAIGDFNNKPVSGLYLLGFYSQRHELYRKKETKDDAPENTN
ncbi:type I-C CRISPR-associated protein Cas8c/Csd1 [Cohnella sp. CIP 111063]|uniref:type I-C CRISPR-associated protein Cas8c/Csd1 n=1 Tax=unclassified Cohnella TaxID=2636738 RepID=UPI000B8BC731|nr:MULTISPECIES: type I-C CRISPR-associated protein Cas8c/Csd1 [unclassified Cohnella]OXS52316.1 type I-C CRISPR-associated protein Cas8c/Csd1 [Cohnella sp. CIP 111063]PRX55995.1 CRISPR-associated Csd1 family protein [Cohnella sp. SGD-V74]